MRGHRTLVMFYWLFARKLKGGKSRMKMDGERTNSTLVDLAGFKSKHGNGVDCMHSDSVHNLASMYIPPILDAA